MNDEYKEGYYKGRAVAGSARFGNAASGGEQLALDLHVPELGRSFTTVLSFAGKAGPYSIERMKACGWKGGADKSLPGIDTNEVDVSISYENYTNGQGETKRQLRVQIATGGFAFKAPMNDKQIGGFLANLTKQMGGSVKGQPMNQGYPAELDDLG